MEHPKDGREMQAKATNKAKQKKIAQISNNINSKRNKNKV